MSVAKSSLLSTDWRSWSVASDWQPTVEAFFTGAIGMQLLTRLQQQLEAGVVIYPPEPLRMLALTPLSQVRVVIVGQDPYHGAGQAEGLAFSVSDGQLIPPSLRNIRKELLRNLGASPQWNGSLASWAKQGVLLLNTVLTVEDSKAASHAGWGWEFLTQQLLKLCDAQPKVFMLWGNHAQALVSQLSLNQTRHCLLSASHPSPLSATRGTYPFIGCGHFEKANEWLEQKKMQKVDWLAELDKNMA
jgi:uracil-DNA glycosylase